MPLRVPCHGRAWPGPAPLFPMPPWLTDPTPPSHCRESLSHFWLNYNPETENAKGCNGSPPPSKSDDLGNRVKTIFPFVITSLRDLKNRLTTRKKTFDFLNSKECLLRKYPYALLFEAIAFIPEYHFRARHSLDFTYWILFKSSLNRSNENCSSVS